jgi:hypothetical protein
MAMQQISVSEIEAEIIGVFRRQTARLKAFPAGWVFNIDATPDRLTGTFYDKERIELRRSNGVGNGHAYKTRDE